MPSTAPLSHSQQTELATLLQPRMAAGEAHRATQLCGLSLVQAARRALLQDTDDARQRAGMQEVDAIVAVIDSCEFNEIRQAVQRTAGAGHGQCTDCHAAIPFERVQIEPQALRCQTLQDQPALS